MWPALVRSATLALIAAAFTGWVRWLLWAMDNDAAWGHWVGLLGTMLVAFAYGEADIRQSPPPSRRRY